MSIDGKYEILNIVDVIYTERMKIIQESISNFKSKNNIDVENFLKNNAVNFCRLKQSITYLLYDKNRLAAYFTLSFKIVDLPVENLSKSMLKQVERFGRKVGNTVQLPCVLLAQWSKNFALENMISGDELLEYLRGILLQIQRLVGGNFVFLECEVEKTRLIERYAQMGFIALSERLSTTGKPLVQLIKKI